MLLDSLARPLLLGIATSAFVVIGAPRALADFWTVGTDPATSDFVNIQAAIYNAESGDTILVGPGEFSGFRLETKPLTILGAPGGESRIVDVDDALFSTESAIRVEFLDQGAVRIGGFTIDIPPSESGAVLVARHVSLAHCLGSVELFDIEIASPAPESWDLLNLAPNNPKVSGYVDVVHCRQVVLSNVCVVGAAQQELSETAPPPTGISTVEGYSGLMLHNSAAWAANCRFEGCPVPHCYAGDPPLAPLRSGSGARLWNSRLTASNCSFEGGRGQTQLGPGCASMLGGAGIELQFGSQVEFLGGPEASVRGGSSLGTALGGPGARLYGPAFLSHPVDQPPVGGFGGSGLIAPSIGEFNPNLVLVQTVDGQGPALIPSSSVAPQGATLELQLHGTPDRTQFVLWDAHLGPQLPSTLIVGALFLDPATAQLLGMFTLDASGSGSATLQVPTGPEFSGLSVALQTSEWAHPLFFSAPPVFLATVP